MVLSSVLSVLPKVYHKAENKAIVFAKILSFRLDLTPLLCYIQTIKRKETEKVAGKILNSVFAYFYFSFIYFTDKACFAVQNSAVSAH